MGCQIRKCDVCGQRIKFNEDAQVTADTILCEDCIIKIHKEGTEHCYAARGRRIANLYNAESNDRVRKERSERNELYAYSIRAPR